MLKVEHLTKSFGAIIAVNDVSFSASRGSITIMTGADGAGKSTLFKMILGLVRKDSGEIFLEGSSIDGKFSKVTQITGYMPEKFSLYSDLSVEENLDFFADIQQVCSQRKKEMKHRLLRRTGMLPYRKRKAGALSGGMKQKLALSTILLSSPEMLILDEPTTGVDPLSRIEFFKIMEDLKKEGKTIVMATPYLDEAEKGDFVIFIKKGVKIKEGSIKEIKDTFPAQMYRVLPKGNIFEVMNQLQAKKEVKGHFYIRGRFIKCMCLERPDFLSQLKAKEVKEEEPTLEDVYIYYQRGIHRD
ncbi:MAG: ATP-binding cassette domain-containing protein [Candidatus Aminicenantes bacterium]|nr:ATP-binding cassette domain-containing protein [Candidatus Aminicenantes bacterium]